MRNIQQKRRYRYTTQLEDVDVPGRTLLISVPGGLRWSGPEDAVEWGPSGGPASAEGAGSFIRSPSWNTGESSWCLKAAVVLKCRVRAHVREVSGYVILYKFIMWFWVLRTSRKHTLCCINFCVAAAKAISSSLCKLVVSEFLFFSTSNFAALYICTINNSMCTPLIHVTLTHTNSLPSSLSHFLQKGVARTSRSTSFTAPPLWRLSSNMESLWQWTPGQQLARG